MHLSHIHVATYTQSNVIVLLATYAVFYAFILEVLLSPPTALYSALQRSTALYSALQRSTALYSALQRSTALYSALQRSTAL